MDVYFTHANGNLSLELWDPTGLILKDSSYSSTDNEQVSWKVGLLDQGNYYIKVFGSGGDTNTYDLRYSVV